MRPPTRPPIRPAGPAEGRGNVDEPDAAAGCVPRAAERMIERGVAEIAAGIARHERRDAPPAQSRHDVLHRQAGGCELRPAIADGSARGQGAGSIGRRRADVAGAGLDLEAARADDTPKCSTRSGSISARSASSRCGAAAHSVASTSVAIRTPANCRAAARASSGTSCIVALTGTPGNGPKPVISTVVRASCMRALCRTSAGSATAGANGTSRLPALRALYSPGFPASFSRHASTSKAPDDPVPARGRLPARRYCRARPLASGGGQHAVAATRRLRRRGDQGRGSRPRAIRCATGGSRATRCSGRPTRATRRA